MRENNTTNNQQTDALEELLKVEESLVLQPLQLLVMETAKLVLVEVSLKKYLWQFKKLWKTLEEIWLMSS